MHMIPTLLLISSCFLSSPVTEYQVIEKMRSGYFSDVYAVKNSNDVIFAMKWSKQKEDQGFSYLYANMEREFRLGQLMEYPAIVRTIEYFTVENDEYLILDFVTGNTIACTPNHSLSFEEAREACLDLVDALLYALSKHYIYVSPNNENMMLDENHRLKIVDVAGFVTYDEMRIHYKYQQKSDEEFIAEILHPIWVRHLNLLTDLCIQIFNKVSIPREERIEKRLALKRIAWNSAEDFDDGKLFYLEMYLNELIFLLESL